MKDQPFNGEDLVSIIVFFQEFKTACYACNIHDMVTMWKLKYYLLSPLKYGMKRLEALPKTSVKAQEGSPKLFSAIVKYWLRRYATDDEILSVDVENTSDSERKRRELISSRGRQPCGRVVMNIKQPSPPKSSGRDSKRSTLTEDYTTQKTKFMRNVIAAMESIKVELDDRNSIDSTQFFQVCLHDKHSSSWCEQVKNIATLIRSYNRNFFNYLN